MPAHIERSKPETLYEAERSLLDRVIPLVHLRETYGIAPRVHIESPTLMLSLST